MNCRCTALSNSESLQPYPGLGQAVSKATDVRMSRPPAQGPLRGPLRLRFSLGLRPALDRSRPAVWHACRSSAAWDRVSASGLGTSDSPRLASACWKRLGSYVARGPNRTACGSSWEPWKTP